MEKGLSQKIIFHEERVRKVGVIHLGASYSDVLRFIDRGKGDGIQVNTKTVPLGVFRVNQERGRTVHAASLGASYLGVFGVNSAGGTGTGLS